MPPDIFTTGQAAKICGVSRMTVKRWLACGEMVGYRLPGSRDWRITRPTLIEFMTRHGIPLERVEGGEPRRRILVVEDQPKILQCVQEVLSRDERLQLRCARHNGYEACLEAGLLKPDLVVIGLMKSEMDGFQLARNIRDNPVIRGAKILFTNGCSSPKCLNKMKTLGNAYLLRPVKNELLLNSIYALAGLPKP